MIGSRGLEILVIEDDRTLRDLFTELLSQEGYQVAGAAQGSDALAYLRTHAPPAAILLDFWMPKMDGREVLEVIRRDRPDLSNVPILILTGAIVSEPRKAGPAAAVRKPFDLDIFRSALARAVGTTRRFTPSA